MGKTKRLLSDFIFHILFWTPAIHTNKGTYVSNQYLHNMFVSSHTGKDQIVIVLRKHRAVAQQWEWDCGKRFGLREVLHVVWTMRGMRLGVDHMSLFWSANLLNAFTRDILTNSTVCLCVYMFGRWGCGANDGWKSPSI